jgi:pro-kumamolisin-like protein/Big-like domain-containing protein
MRSSKLSLMGLVFLAVCLGFVPLVSWSQAAAPESRIVDRANDNVVVTLRGNTHPRAQRQFDRGIAPPDLPMARMLLVLGRSDAQESALQKLLDDQQNLNSPSYHRWLTPDEFGRQFGPSDQDVQTVAAWLRSHGFQVGMVGRGRTVIEFSGTASQVQQAFHAEIHKFTVNGEDHWANANDPQIPAALAPVVVGIASLHNFPKRPMNRVIGKFSKDRHNGQVTPLIPEFTTTDSNNCPPPNGVCYFVGPYDFAAIYNVSLLWNAASPIDGTGQSIAIADESNINLQDARDFRSLFGLPANDPQVIVDGTDPGIISGLSGLETESLLDVEWAGAVAKGATIKLVVSAPTNATEGADLAAVYAIENNLAPVVSESFGDCELDLGDAGNNFENAIRQQAAAQGITFITAAGDQGSATCDGYQGTTPEPATFGLAVSGLASSPNGVAVGGTDFLNFGSNYNLNSPSPYWSPNNDSNQASALGYVPESTWNDSCTNSLFVVLGAGSTPEASCNNPQLSIGVLTLGGGGGKSNCTTSTGASPSNCVSGYVKPSWQAAPGVPSDGARDIPDVSLFSGGGLMGSTYIVCEADMFPGHGSCSLSTPQYTFVGVGGTSGSAPAFAGILALVNQYTGSSGQGNANYILYKLASSSAQTAQSTCNATGNPAAGCIFHDITSGTIAMACARSSPNCTFSNSSDTFGVLSGYGAGPGYDLATGLGSVNANNLVHDWIQPAATSTTTLVLNGGKAVSITHGQSIPFDITVTPAAATGAVLVEGTPAGAPSVPMASFPLQNGSASGNTAALAGGTSYAVKAHYPGDGTYRPSDSAPVTVTVAPEPSKTLLTIPQFDPTTGQETGNMPTSLTYGSPYVLRVDVGNSQAATSFPSKLVCALLTCPTGNVTVTDSLKGAAPVPLDQGTFALNSGGYTEDIPIQLTGGTHQLSASYPGDNSYQPSTGSYSLTVTPAPTQMQIPGSSLISLIGTTAVFSETGSATSPFPGAAPTGTITFFDGANPLQGTTSFVAAQGTSATPANLSATINTTFTTSGTHTITAKYSGDANYGASTSPSTNISVLYPTTCAVSANSTNINLGQSVTITTAINSGSKAPPMTGTFQFLGGSATQSPVTVTPGTDATGNQMLTAVVTITPQSNDSVEVLYDGDSNYSPTSGSISISVIIPDFSFGSGSPAMTVTAGQSGSTIVPLTPLSNISSAVAMSCSSIQIVGASCSFNPTTVNLNNGTATSSTLSVSVPAPSTNTTTSLAPLVAPISRRLAPMPWECSGLIGGLAFIFLVFSVRRRSFRPAVACLGMAGLLFLLSCASSGGDGGGGGGGGGSSAITTTLTLATSSTKIASGGTVTFTVTVSPSSTPAGAVIIYDPAEGVIGEAPIVNGSASIPVSGLSVGTHSISAQYEGYQVYLPSHTNGSLNVAVTGTAQVSVQGATGTLIHTIPVNVTVQ